MSQVPRVPTMGEVVAEVRRIQARLFRPVTKDTVYYHYLPLLGVKSYVELATTMAAPRLMGNIYSSIGLPRDLNTVNTVAAATCLALHLYNRPTFGGTPLVVRGAYSGFHSLLFVLGSLLAWGVLARELRSPPLRFLVIVGSSMAMLKTTMSSLDHVDSRLGNTLGKK